MHCNFDSLARRNCDYHAGETWRPKSRAASTNVATTPARIAEGGTPASHQMHKCLPHHPLEAHFVVAMTQDDVEVKLR